MKCYYDFQGLNIIYLDAPVGAGFSYSETDNGYIMDDYVHAAQVYEFLHKVKNRSLRSDVWYFKFYVVV
jgi:carboxypeptidase C (cathepsin A)